ncbi:pectin lyase fold/virulence factor [Calycina marina]|uniref:Pectin lyase fold/virulence factor n=1 Tax=Calycina marina TaxID=1763456 RepID=A0A9P7Z5X9_9HELO|nr:pectin lyase fold/virulence factor [Calycina marina]
MSSTIDFYKRRYMISERRYIYPKALDFHWIWRVPESWTQPRLNQSPEKWNFLLSSTLLIKPFRMELHEPCGKLSNPTSSNTNTGLSQADMLDLGTVLLFTGYMGCILDIQSTINVTTVFSYWNGKGKIIYLKNTNGATIYSSHGKGVIIGNGQASWDYILTTAGASYSRPNLLRLDGSTEITIKGLTIKNAPQLHVATSRNSKNIYREHIGQYWSYFEGVFVTIDDGCVVLKPGAYQVHAKDIACIGGHGLSIGSTGERQLTSLFTMNLRVGCDYAIEFQSCYEGDAISCADNANVDQATRIIWSIITAATGGSKETSISQFAVKAPSGKLTVLCRNTPRTLYVTFTSGVFSRQERPIAAWLMLKFQSYPSRGESTLKRWTSHVDLLPKPRILGGCGTMLRSAISQAPGQ